MASSTVSQPTRSDVEDNVRFRPAQLLIAAAIFHLMVTVIVYGLGRYAILPGTFDTNGIAISFAPDCIGHRVDAAALSEVLARGEILDWTKASSPFHLKLYSISFALFGWLLGWTVISAEPLNLLCYLAILVLVFKLGREISNERAGLLAAGTVALWPSLLLHTTQLLKDPLFVVGMLALILSMLRGQSKIYTWPEALLKGTTGALIAVALWLVRADMGEIIIATALLGSGILVAQQFSERRFQAMNLSAMMMLLAITLCVPQVLPGLRTPDPARVSHKEMLRREAVSTTGVEATRAEISAEPTPTNIWSRAAMHVWTIRRRFIRMYPDAGSNIDSDVSLTSTGDLIRYLPRAAAIGFFAPFPRMWFASGKHVGLTGRLLIGLESMMMYAVECLAIYGLWRGRRRFSVWLIFSVAAMGMIALGLVVVNVGTLYRMRYVFLMLIIVIAAGGAVHILDRFLRKPLAV